MTDPLSTNPISIPEESKLEKERKTGALAGKTYSPAPHQKSSAPVLHALQEEKTAGSAERHEVSAHAGPSQTEKVRSVFQEEVEGMARPSAFQVHETALANAHPLEPLLQEQLEKVNAELRQAKIPLECKPVLTELPQGNKNAIYPKNIKDYIAFLSSLTRQTGTPLAEELGIQLLRMPDLARRVVENIDIISFEAFQKGLSACITTLNSLLKDQDYALGYAVGKSQEWLSQQAVPYVTRSPSSTFSVDATGSGTISEQGVLDTVMQHYVMFDDASYSGKQVREMLVGLAKAIISKNPQAKNIHVYLVIPFVSESAKDTIALALQEDSCIKQIGLHVHLITTDRKVKPISDTLSSEEIQELARETGAVNSRHCLTIMEWKIPDGSSFPIPFRRGVQIRGEGDDQEVRRFPLFTDKPAPYKTTQAH